MDVLMSNWKDVQSMPASYVFPPEKRPGKLYFPDCEDIPIIDLQKLHLPDQRSQVIHQIIKASQHLGYFQVVNHGISESLTEEAMDLVTEFLGMPADYKARFYSTDMSKKCRIFSSTLNYDKEEFHYWRDNFTHHCHPLEDNILSWPENPPRYRDVISTYSVQVRKFLLTILDLICEGLGLRPGFFEGEYTKTQLFSVNHHIPCPDPSSTLAVPEHLDPNVITMVHNRQVPGFQLFKDEEWLNVKTLPTAVFVITGLQLKVITNDLFTSPVHRVVAHSKETRTTMSSFLVPSTDGLIEPAEALLNPENPAVYKGFTYEELFAAFTGKGWGLTLETFKK